METFALVIPAGRHRSASSGALPLATSGGFVLCVALSRNGAVKGENFTCRVHCSKCLRGLSLVRTMVCRFRDVFCRIDEGFSGAQVYSSLQAPIFF